MDSLERRIGVEIDKRKECLKSELLAKSFFNEKDVSRNSYNRRRSGR